jgi:hypothetical protein
MQSSAVYTLRRSAPKTTGSDITIHELDRVNWIGSIATKEQTQLTLQRYGLGTWAQGPRSELASNYNSAGPASLLTKYCLLGILLSTTCMLGLCSACARVLENLLKGLVWSTTFTKSFSKPQPPDDSLTAYRPLVLRLLCLTT